MKLKLCTLFILFILSFNIHPTVRYVSKSGTSVSPYTSWATASDSIQKAINVSRNGDTIVVAEGVYKETLYINRSVFLTGTSMDSTIVDSRGLKGYPDASVAVNISVPGCTIRNFHFYGLSYGRYPQPWNGIVRSTDYSSTIEDCLIEWGGSGISQLNGSVIRNCFIRKCYFEGYAAAEDSSSIESVMENCVILTDADGIKHIGGGKFRIVNNIIIVADNTSYPFRTGFHMGPPFFRGLIANNLFIGGEENGILAGYPDDTLKILNNVIVKSQNTAESAVYITISERTVFRNNIIAYNNTVGVDGFNHNNIDYNLYWGNLKNRQAYKGIPPYAPHDVIADPMFVNDSITYSYPIMADFHLQKYSPCIDSGDPTILDKDGSRSDIGLYGGPYGESYSYQDLSPKVPRGLTMKGIDSITVELKWRRNTERDTSKYLVYSSIIPGVMDDSLYYLTETKDTLLKYTFSKGRKIYFRVKAVDLEGNRSALSEEIGMDITSVDNPVTTPEEYTLYPNYPNPFNPSTTIGYRLKESGKVRLTVYDIKGEIVRTLQNSEQTKGYHEVRFNAEGLSSGIYLCRIEVTGKGGIPQYSDMRKMVYLK